MGIGGEGAFFGVEFALFIDISLIDVDGEDIGDKHIVGPQRDDLCHSAFDGNGAFFHHRAGNLACLLAGQLTSGKFIQILAALNAAKINGTNDMGRGQIDNKFS